MKKLIRSKYTGKFLSPSTPKSVVNGRLYEYKGAIVRAKKLCNNGLRMVSFHKKLNGFVRDEDLRIVSKDAVTRYLDKA